MKTKHVIGQRIVEVRQGMTQTSSGRANAVEFIRLENGVRLFPLVHEGDSDYSVDLVVNRVGQKNR